MSFLLLVFLPFLYLASVFLGAGIVAEGLSVFCQLPDIHVHEHDAVHVEVNGFEKRRVGLREVAHAHQGMGGGLAEEGVELVDVGNYFCHGC